MRRALELATLAKEKGDVPVGAVAVKDGVIVGEGYNTREADGDVTGHAECNCLRDAAGTLGTWKLEGCDVYVTLEPCPMCAAALADARVRAVWFGAYDKRMGAVESMTRLYDLPLPRKPAFYGGIMEEETGALLSSFFEERRNDLRKEPKGSC